MQKSPERGGSPDDELLQRNRDDPKRLKILVRVFKCVNWNYLIGKEVCRRLIPGSTPPLRFLRTGLNLIQMHQTM